MSILEAKTTILETKKAVLEAKRPILEAKMARVKLYVDFLERSVEWRRPLAKPESSEFSLGELVTVPYASHP